ncbi:MAG: peptidoglycan DD-metalloendopeptidase family protein [Woeseiaceae bacterium]|nr:peptidoglycan DD-metalloendopeptidase family protein [Woeseiaceae bacterium]
MTDSLAQSMAQHARGLEPVAGLTEILQYLRSPDFAPAPVIHSDGKAIVLDLSATGPILQNRLSGIGVARLSQLIDAEMQRAGTGFAFGRYGEKRALYDNEHFASGSSGERRTIHMGIDLFCKAGTPIHTPLDAELCIVANNTQELDYGPMLVLRHLAGQREFYTLYGHLRLASIRGLREGQRLPAGAQIAEVGAPPENGNWPPHLHFQLIVDLLGLGRDFPGVAYESQRDFWLALSPSPAMFFPECDAVLLEATS